MDSRAIPIIALIAAAAILIVFAQSALHQAAPNAPAQIPVGAGTQPQAIIPEVNLTGLDYRGLVALDIPLACTMGISPGGEKASAAVFIKGNNTRVDYSAQQSGSKARMGFIVSGKYGYIYVKEMTSGSAVGRGCDWAKFPANSPCIATKVDPEFGLARSLNCTTGNFGDEKFAPEGAICDTSDRNSPETIALSSFFPCMN